MRKKRLALKPQSHPDEGRGCPAPEGRVSYKWSGIFGILLGATPFAGQTQLEHASKLLSALCSPSQASLHSCYRQISRALPDNFY